MLGAGTQQQQFIRIIRNELMKLQSPAPIDIADRATISVKPALSISSHHHHHKKCHYSNS
jgi:hypothetical protein